MGRAYYQVLTARQLKKLQLLNIQVVFVGCRGQQPGEAGGPAIASVSTEADLAPPDSLIICVGAARKSRGSSEVREQRVACAVQGQWATSVEERWHA
jgi:hypothetical protein